MKTWALLCVLLLSPQTKPETVALIFGPEPVRIEVMKTEEAEKLYAKLKPKHDAGTLTEQESMMFAALTQALGTLRQDTVQCHKGVRGNWVGELFVCGN